MVSASFLVGYSFYRKLTRPFASADSANSYDISKEEIFSVLFVSIDSFGESTPVTSDIKLAIYDNKSKDLTEVSVSKDLLVDVPGKYGEEELYKVVALGSSVGKEGIDSGIEMLRSSIKKVLGFEVNKFVVVEDSIYERTVNSLQSGGFENLIAFLSNASSAKTNLGVNEVYYINNLANQFSSSDIKKVNVGLADSTDIEKTIRDITFDSAFAEERKSIAVLNGTNVGGVATYGARVIENMGGRVIAVDNSRLEYEKSIIITDAKEGVSSKAIQDFFGVETVLLKSNSSDILDDAVSRADITIIIGFDIVNAL